LSPNRRVRRSAGAYVAFDCARAACSAVGLGNLGLTPGRIAEQDGGMLPRQPAQRVLNLLLLAHRPSAARGRVTQVAGRRRFALRFALGPLFGLFAAGALGGAFAPGCTYTIVESRCPIDREGKLTVPLECCPCPTPESCEFFYYSKGLTPPPVPASCCEKYADLPDPLPGCADGGVQGLVACTDPCVPAAPEGWTGPELVSVGSRLFAEECPANAPNTVFEGWFEPVIEPPTCPSCACDEPLGTCKLPETWTVRSEPCGGDGIETPFDPPPGWDGMCSAADTIPAGQLCDGKPCVRSLWVSAPPIEEQPCEVVTGQVDPGGPPKLVPFAPPPTSTTARACAPSAPWSTCQEEPDKLCLPKAGSEFSTCMRKPGDEACPEGWPVRHVVYEDVDVDTSCSPCSCSPPSGGTCSAAFSAHSDSMCGGPPNAGVVGTGLPGQCVDLLPGVALASKQAALLSYEPGKCEPSGGEPVLSVELDGATTICCLLGP
jgi:hypothetical protein